MLGLLAKIWCAVTNVAWWVADLFVGLLNALVAVLAAAAGAVLSLFPDLPDVPANSLPGEVLHWANWLFPVAALLAMFGTYLAVYIVARLYMAAVRMMDRLGMLDTGR